MAVGGIVGQGWEEKKNERAEFHDVEAKQCARPTNPALIRFLQPDSSIYFFIAFRPTGEIVPGIYIAHS